MIGQYTLGEAIKNGWFLVLTKLFYPKARLVRRPVYIRGKRHLEYGHGLTTGYSCRFDLSGRGKTLSIGCNCKMNDRVHISAYESITIGDNVLMASNIFITDNNHGQYGTKGVSPHVAPDGREIVTKPTTIGDNVWIGEGVCILPGVNVGYGSVIGSNSVVTHDVPPMTIAAGSPAEVLKIWDDESGEWIRVKK